jgi:D-glycero-D-manno-heptose 1,7-bisphosphate phosphatase
VSCGSVGLSDPGYPIASRLRGGVAASTLGGHASTPEDHASTPEGHASTPEDHASTPEGHASTPEDHASTPEDHASTPEGHASTLEGRACAPGSRPAIFLDRDGVLNELVIDPVSGTGESPLEVKDVRLLAGAAAAARTLVRMGFALVCVSNQPAAAKRRVSVQQLLAVHGRVVELLAHEGVHLDASRLCLHHPAGTLPGLSGPCTCRKPAPGMLLDAMRVLHIDPAASWMIGDTDADIGAGHAAGCRTLLIEHPASIHKRQRAAQPDLTAADLARAAELLRGQ